MSWGRQRSRFHAKAGARAMYPLLIGWPVTATLSPPRGEMQRSQHVFRSLRLECSSQPPVPPANARHAGNPGD
jgi:hypothetical protein